MPNNLASVANANGSVSNEYSTGTCTVFEDSYSAETVHSEVLNFISKLLNCHPTDYIFRQFPFCFRQCNEFAYLKQLKLLKLLRPNLKGWTIPLLL